jgi:NAD(P)-dependent dehydrogenase (short-subunit alcohol dehydrogenase family)
MVGLSSRLVRKYSAVLKNDGITTALIHPGKFNTGMMSIFKKSKPFFSVG